MSLRLLPLPTVALAATLAVGLAPVPAHAEDDQATQVMLLLDVSGSMNESVDGSSTKLEAARKALRAVGESLPEGTQVGLRVYGSEIAESKEVNPAACEDTELVMPMGALQRDRMYAAADSFEAKGETPIAYSLEQTVGDFEENGKKVVVLISDGEENCSPDPCATAEELADAGVDLQFNAVGFGVNNEARSQLTCIAEKGGGAYFDADNTDELVEAIEKLATRALRPFAISGTPVEGTSTAPGAPVVGAGQYTDTMPVGETLHYRIERSVPGSWITATADTVMTPDGIVTQENWSATLSDEQGNECASEVDRSSSSFTSDRVLGVAVRSTDACSDGPLFLAIERDQVAGGTDAAKEFEIVIDEEPPITNYDQLPEPATMPSGQDPVEEQGDTEAVTGGTAFSDAGEIGEGSWRDEVTVGETVLYKVPLEAGQSFRATVVGPGDGDPPVDGAASLVVRSRTLGVDRAELASTSTVLMRQNSPAELTVGTPEVRVRNRESSGAVASASQAGDYYLAVEVEPGQPDLRGRILPIQVNLAIEGEPAGAPVHAEPEPTAEPSIEQPTEDPAPVTEGEPGTPRWVPLALVGGGVLLLGVGAGAGLLIARRVRR
ncbi:vWA domain-containing protein [Naumannella halotolerans]|uniref:Ca-activated chloride channel family protein n=1 Tax=Naumannella halotolerans TaxID=993414 RepID=A0A4R7J4L0_9ACTN|nr:VWA domain-containing protein [Naumannella halotolerans]TDT31273.1 Ca-activated chloride channel family protein [Naumannella halotolerans]